jgi:hypothetical protein
MATELVVTLRMNVDLLNEEDLGNFYYGCSSHVDLESDNQEQAALAYHTLYDKGSYLYLIEKLLIVGLCANMQIGVLSDLMNEKDHRKYLHEKLDEMIDGIAAIREKKLKG